MKKTILLPFAILFTIISAKAQTSSENNSTSFIAAMVANIKQLDTASTTATLTSLANSFERIGKAEKTKWQPYYYAAYCNALMAYKTTDPASIDNLAYKAETLLLSAKEIDENNSEITCLFAMIQSSRILADPVNRFQAYSKEVHNLLGKAKLQNVNNPRIYFLEARFLLRTPEMFGGGKKIAKKSAEIAVIKFNTFIPEDRIAPHWGEMQAKEMAANLEN